MTATLAEARTALASAMSGISGLRTADTVPGQVTPPHAVVTPAPGLFGDYEVALGPATPVEWHLRIVLLVATGSNPAAQAALDAYVNPTGTNSVPAAINADPTLGGVVDFAVVMRAERYGLMEWAGQEYLAAELYVKVAP